MSLARELLDCLRTRYSMAYASFEDGVLWYDDEQVLFLKMASTYMEAQAMSPPGENTHDLPSLQDAAAYLSIWAVSAEADYESMSRKVDFRDLILIGLAQKWPDPVKISHTGWLELDNAPLLTVSNDLRVVSPVYHIPLEEDPIKLASKFADFLGLFDFEHCK